MVKNIRSPQAIKAQRPRLYIQSFLVLMTVGFSFVGFIDSADDSKTTITHTSDIKVDTISTGSIENTSAPNRAAKVARNKPQENISDFAFSFNQSRIQIAQARVKKSQATRLANSKQNKIKIQTTLTQTASINTNIVSEALDAISNVASLEIDKTLPSPISVSSNLAYARANTPATKFTSPAALRVSNKQLQCLAQGVYFEARGEPYRGQVAVAQVIMNRVKHKLYPNTICGVVYQNQHKRNACQFSFACDGIKDRVNEKKAWQTALEVSKKVTNGSIYLSEVSNATHYHANYVRPKWAKKMKRLTVIGVHKFYRFKSGWNWS